MYASECLLANLSTSIARYLNGSAPGSGRLYPADPADPTAPLAPIDTIKAS